MRLGVGLPLASDPAELRDQVALGITADELGYDAVWVPEAYGADAVSVLATIGARTERIAIGSAVLQIPGRTPAMTAMTAASLDALSHGRFRLGLGVSGPQVSEGWHGVPFADPLGRTAEYVQIVRDALARRRVTADGRHFTLPLPGGLGKSLLLALRPEREHIPIYLAAVGPRNLELTGRIADGWLGIFFDAQHGGEQVRAVHGAAQAAGRDPAALDIAVQVPVSLADDLVAAAARIRPYAALYIGGMGARRANFYHRIAASMGYPAEADLVQQRFLSRDYAGAAEAVPQEFLERTCLLGDEGQIAAGLRRLASVGVTTVNINPAAPSLQGRRQVLDTVRRIAHADGLLG